MCAESVERGVWPGKKRSGSPGLVGRVLGGDDANEAECAVRSAVRITSLQSKLTWAASWSFSVHERAGVAVTPEEMRAKALECESKSRAARDVGMVRMYTELANQWRELAGQIERKR